MYKPAKSSFLGKVPAAKIHQEKLTESNVKRFHALEKRKDCIVETYIKSQTSSVKHNITVVNLECKDLCDIDLQGNGLEKELLNSKIRNAFAILKPSKELPLNSKTDQRTMVSKDSDSPRYKRSDIRVHNQNSPIPIKEQEAEKYKRDQRRVVQRPHSQTPRSEIEKYIKAFETNGYFLRTKSEEDDQSFSSILKGQNPGKYKRQQSRFAERPHSQTSWEEIEKHIKSFNLKNKISHFQKSTEENFNPSSGKKYLGKSEREKFQPLEKPHSKRPKSEIEKSSVDLDKDSDFQPSSYDLWVQNLNLSQPIGEKKPGKYKRSERILAERPYSQPSKKEIEKYLKVPQKWNDSLFLESKSRNSSLGNDNENLAPLKQGRKYRRKSKFEEERPSSQILGSKIQEFVEIFESKSKCSHESNFEKLKFGTREKDLKTPEPEMSSMEYPRHQPNYTDKSCSQISRTDFQNSESFEHDDQSFSHRTERFTNQNLPEPSENIIERNKPKYSRNHRQNNRSRSAPTVFMQTNVPNYSECSSVESSSSSFTRNKKNNTKEAEENEEALSVELKHQDTLRKATLTSLLTGRRLKSPDITTLQNGYFDRRNLRNKSDNSDILSLQSIYNRRPNKKAGEDIKKCSTIKENTDFEPEKHLPISPQHKKERLISNPPPESLQENHNFDLENNQIKLDIPRETRGTCPSNCNKPDSISKADEFHQNNSKTNHLLLDNVQTNAPLYYLKLSHGKEKLVTRRKELKEPSQIIENSKSSMSNNSNSLSFSSNLENEISAKSKSNPVQNESDRHSGHFIKDTLPETNTAKTKPNIVQNENDRHFRHFMKEILPDGNNAAKIKSNFVQNGNDRHSGNFMKDILPDRDNTAKFKTNLGQNKNDSYSEHLMKKILPETNTIAKTKTNCVQNENNRHSGHFMKEILPEAENTAKTKTNLGKIENDKHSGNFMKEILTETENTAKTKNNFVQNENDRNSGHFMKHILPEAVNTAKSKTYFAQNKNDSHSEHLMKEILPETNNIAKTKTNFVQNENNRHSGHFIKDTLSEADDIAKIKTNLVQIENDRHSGHFMKEILPETNNIAKTKTNFGQNENERHSGHFMKEILSESENTAKTKSNFVQNLNARHSGQSMKDILPETENTPKIKTNSVQNENVIHSRHFIKEILPRADDTAKTKNNSVQNTNNRHSGQFMKEILPEADDTAKTKTNFVQNENNSHSGHSTEDILPEADKQTPLLKERHFFNTYHHFSEANRKSLELDYPSHPLDQENFPNVLETKENYSVAKAPRTLNLSIDKKLSPVRVRNGQNQSSENEMGPAKLDWSISEISIVENEIEAEELTMSCVDRSILLTPVENDIHHFPTHDPEVSKKIFSNTFIELREELKRSFSSSQISRNSVKKYKKLEFPSTKDEIESVKCLFMLRKFFSSWKKEWYMHLAAKVLWKRHSLQKGINALRQSVQNSQLISGVLQEKIKKVWLKSCFQKWKQEMGIKQHDQLAAAFQEWKENAEEQKRFRILKQIHHKNMLLLCFQKWRSHYRSKIMFLRALGHNRMSLLYSMWHHWITFVEQNQQKKFMRVMARKYQSKKLQSRTLKGLVSVYRNLIKAKSHYRSKEIQGNVLNSVRLQKLKMALQCWRRGAAISSHQSEQIVVAVQQCSNELVLRRTLDIWVHQLWLICESRRADRWILSRYMSVWHRKWCCMISWRQRVVAKIEYQQTHAIIHKWHQNVQLQKRRHKLATRHIQKVLLIQLLTKWRRFALRQVKSRLHLQTQVTNGQYRTKIQVLLMWRKKLLEKQKARQIYYLWSEQCVRKAINRWKVSHHQATLDKRVLLFQPLRNVLIQKEIFWKWKHAWEKANKEKEDVHRSRAILQLKLLGAIFHKWHSQTLGTLAAKPFIQHRQSQLLSRIFKAWHHFLWEKHQRRKKSLQLQNYHLKQLFYKWRNSFILREKEKNLKISHSRKLLCNCILGWQIVIQRKTKALHFHQRMLFQNFFFWKEKTTHSLRCKAMKVAEQHCCRTVQQHFFSRWRQNAIEQKIHRTESMQHIEKIQKENILTQALTSWKHLLKIRILARNHYNHRLVILMRQVLVKWHWFTEYTSCFAVRCLQRQLHIDTWIECPHDPKHNGWHWQEEELLQDELNKENGSATEESHQTTGTDEDTLDTIGHRNQKVMTRLILQLKYWPMSLAFLQWRQYTQMCHQLKTVTHQLHMKHITVVLSTTFCLWRQQQRAAKLARCHQEHKLMKRSFREIQKYAVCRRSKKVLLAKARNHHCVAVFKTCFPIWQKKVKEKQYWDKVAKLLSHSSPEEQLLQPMEFQLTSLLGQRSLQTYFHIWKESYQQASFYCQRYHQRILIRYLHIWRSWATYRQHLSQKCNVFRKKRIQSLALQVWSCRVHQNKWIKKTQGQKVNCLLLIILRQWHQWSSKSSKQKAAESKVRQNHVTLILSQVFNSITREFRKINEACQWYQNQLIKKVIIAWSLRSQYQIQERDKIKKFQQQKNKAMIQRSLQVWKHAYLVRCEAKYNRQQRIHLKVCCIAVHWKKRAKKTRGKILEAVFMDRMVRSCFSVWSNRFDMMKQLEGQLHLFTSWKQLETQRHLFDQWKSTLLVTRADQAFKNKLLTIVWKGWQNWTRASRLYQRRFQEYKNVLQERHLESTFRIWKIGWKHKQTSTKLFKQNIQSRALKAWYYYVQDQVRLKILQAYMTKQLRARHLLSAYCKWKGMVTARLNERRKEKQQAVIAEKHYKTHLSMVFFHAWRQETLISRCIVRHQMHLAYKYYSRWKYYTDLSYTAALWSEKLSYNQVWCKWRAAFIREKTAATMEAEFCQQNIRQIFRIWYQYCRYKKIHEKESLFPGICLNLANI